MLEIIKRYLEAWNETDAAARLSLVESLWTADGSYTDPLADVHGPDAIAGLMGAAQQQFPGLVFTLGGPVDTNHNQARFTWHLGPAGARARGDRVRRGGAGRRRSDRFGARVPGQGARGGLTLCLWGLRGGPG